MPAQSTSQQRLFGMVDAYKKGKLKKAPEKIKEVAKHISLSDTLDFARTKHDGLPERVTKEAKSEKSFEDKLKSGKYGLLKTVEKYEKVVGTKEPDFNNRYFGKNISEAEKKAFCRGFEKAAMNFSAGMKYNLLPGAIGGILGNIVADNLSDSVNKKRNRVIGTGIGALLGAEPFLNVSSGNTITNL